MSHLDFSEDDLIDAMSTVSTTSEVDSRNQSPCLCPATPKLPVDEITPVADAAKEWKHPKFYWSDFVDIQVDDTLYRVPRVMMRQPETLKDILPTENSITPLYVDGITSQEMEAFLDVSDARLVTGEDHFTFEQWAGALAVANRMAIPAPSAQGDGDLFDQPPPPEWAAMSESLDTALSIEAKRLIELETALSKPEFRSPLPSGKSSPDSVTQGMPHPKHWQTDLKTIKARNCLYQLPIRYFEKPHLLEGNRGHKGLSLDAHDIITLPSDVAVSDWNVFLEILTACPFDEPLLSLGFSAWMTGLRLAERFGHGSARGYIIRRIEAEFPSQDPVDLLEAAKIAGASDSDWLRGLYTRFSQRSGPISLGDMRRIGEEATVQVWKLRDRFMYDQGYRRNQVNFQ